MGRTSRRGSEVDGIVPVVHGLNVKDRLFASARSIVPRVLAKGPLFAELIRRAETLQSDFACRRNGKARYPSDDGGSFSIHRSEILEL